jgi:hypothetical protein
MARLNIGVTAQLPANAMSIISPTASNDHNQRYFLENLKTTPSGSNPYRARFHSNPSPENSAAPLATALSCPMRGKLAMSSLIYFHLEYPVNSLRSL